MAALVAAIHALLAEQPEKQDVDGRDKPGHDESKCDGYLAPVALAAAVGRVTASAMAAPSSLAKQA
jgi:hypothetical protein